MDVFHVVIDTSVLRQAHFQQANFKRLLRRSQTGALKIYIPYIALEELRTHMIDERESIVRNIQSGFEQLQRPFFGMLTEGMSDQVLSLATKDDVNRNSREVFDKFMETNKIEVIQASLEDMNEIWARYFDAAPPFNPSEKRENRRKDIPDAAIFVAARKITTRTGRHCALVKDQRLAEALTDAGFEVYDDIEKLDTEIEKATSVAPLQKPIVDQASIQLNQLRSPAFEGIDVIILGVNEALNAPSKVDLFTALERVGLDRTIIEHEARTLVLSGRLEDTGSHFVPTNRDLARQAMETKIVTDALLKII